MLKPIAVFCFIVASWLPASAQESKIGSLLISNAYARATPPAARAGAGYLVLTNKGDTPDRLISLSSTFAPRVEMHEMTMAGSVMKMRALKDGITIAPGETVELKPGGMHVMFMDMSTPLREGDAVELKLQFEKSGTATLRMPVKAAGSGGHGHH